MPGLVPGIHVLSVEETKEDWMAGTSPAMTRTECHRMHDIRFIRDNPDAFDRGLKRRGLAAQAQRLIALDEDAARQQSLRWRPAQARRNAASKEIGEAKKNKDEEKARGCWPKLPRSKKTIPALEAEEKKARAKARNERACGNS